MASHDFEQQYRQHTDEGQPFVTGQRQPFRFSYLCRLDPVINQVALQRQENGFNFGCEFDGSRISTRGRREKVSCDTLRRILCWAVANVVLACAIVIGLLLLLQHVNSPLLRSEGHNDFTEVLLIGSNDQRECKPCLGNEQIDVSSSKRPNCCIINQEALKKFIEKITGEILSVQFSATLKQGNVSSIGREMSAEGQSRCGALFLLYEDENKNSESDDYSVLRGWNTDGNVAYMRRPCISYNDFTGEVTVSQDGFYIVYSHLGFLWKASNDSKPASKILSQQIRVETPDIKTKEPISTDKRVIQPNNPLAGSIPSYNSRTLTIVYLRSGVKLTVLAKPSELVVRGNAISTFGLYRL